MILIVEFVFDYVLYIIAQFSYKKKLNIKKLGHFEIEFHLLLFLVP